MLAWCGCGSLMEPAPRSFLTFQLSRSIGSWRGGRVTSPLFSNLAGRQISLYWQEMLARVVALLVAFAIGAVWMLPTMAAHRCLTMGTRMGPEHECCPPKPEHSATISRPCCESVAAPHGEIRSTVARAKMAIASPLVLTLLSFSVPTLPLRISALSPARFRSLHPPGERLHKLSTILRI